ncbi:MAG: hypothetical protein GXO35_04185 [Gammaproteobacteria bacterium]|nr:hypothetical protein [Gammaproteobacteria bacterium]
MPYLDYKQRNDEELIEIFVNGPDTPQGRTAKEILEYRKYKAMKMQNVVLLIFTGIMVLGTVFPIIKFLICGCY